MSENNFDSDYKELYLALFGVMEKTRKLFDDAMDSLIQARRAVEKREAEARKRAAEEERP